MTTTSLSQRADYTHKHNRKNGRHGWLRLTPAYSVKVVDEILSEWSPSAVVLDPFCGTGTTALCAAERGHQASTVEINPFLVWLASVKTSQFTSKEIESTLTATKAALKLIQKPTFPSMQEPPIHNIDRWWSKGSRGFLCKLLPAIEGVTMAGSAERNLLLIAFCRTLISISNAAFNHQSMSFQSPAQSALTSCQDFAGGFRMDVEKVLSGAEDNPIENSEIVHGDARALKQLKRKFDLVITSPPYANRMSYIRELRPYMYWLKFLTDARDAGELDWKAIGGTWGIATSRLQEWAPAEKAFTPKWLPKILTSIAHDENANGALLSKYVAKYSEDMWYHFSCLPHILKSDGHVHYIVGNSTFYGTLVPTEKIYVDMLSELGFKNVNARPIRKRNSKKELIEFDVTATWKK